jgi:hypothetical protein
MTCILTDEDLRYLGIHPRFHSVDDVLLDTPDPRDPRNADRFSIAKLWTSIILSKHNQDVVALINGPKGTGKSNLSLALLWRCAELMAERLGGEAKDYFSIDRVAIMDDDESMELLKDERRHPLTLLDDYGKVARARKWQSEINQATNDIVDTFRDRNGITLMNTVDQNRVDKYQREIGAYYLESVRNPAAMDHGFTVFKLFERVKYYRSGQVFNKYLHWKNEVVIRIVCERAPKWLEDEYNEKRSFYARKVRAEAMAAKEEEKKPGRVDRAVARAAEKQQEYDQLVETGMTHKEILKEIRISRSTWEYWKSQDWVTDIR